MAPLSTPKSGSPQRTGQSDRDHVALLVRYFRNAAARAAHRCTYRQFWGMVVGFAGTRSCFFPAPGSVGPISAGCRLRRTPNWDGRLVSRFNLPATPATRKPIPSLPGPFSNWPRRLPRFPYVARPPCPDRFKDTCGRGGDLSGDLWVAGRVQCLRLFNRSASGCGRIYLLILTRSSLLCLGGWFITNVSVAVNRWPC